jgi:hypothetical protein
VHPWGSLPQWKIPAENHPPALHFPEGTKGGKGGSDWAGLHHFGFVVENETATEQEIKKHGGEFFMQLPNYPGVDAEKKFKDINGIVFDVSEHGWG